MAKHILVALPLTPEQKDRLQAGAPALEYRFTTVEEAALPNVLWADAILGNVPVPLIRQNEHLEWFQSNAAGPDAYLAEGVLPERCVISNATGAYGLAISEWMLGMWLGIMKDLFRYRDLQTKHEWAVKKYQVKGLVGSRVLCIGMGDIGSNFARRAHALGAEVVGVRRTVNADTPCPDYCLRVVSTADIDKELPEADCVAMSLPGTPETKYLFNAERFAKCKPGAILLNVGRGNTVDCNALADAVINGPLYGAAVDVTDPEPLPADHPLWSIPTVLITPHASGNFTLPKTLDNIVDIFAHNLAKFAAGETLDNQVSRATHYVSGDSAGKRLQS